MAATLVPAAWVCAGDWTQYRGPNSSGVSEETVLDKGWGDGPKPVWKVPIGEGFGTFAVVKDRAYLFVSRAGKETAVALDAGTGKEIWATPVDDAINDRDGGSNPRSTPTVVGDHVYVLSVNLKLACLRADTGQAVWNVDLMKEMGASKLQWGNAASPVTDGERIYVAGGGAGKSMAAFDLNSGKVLWAVGNEKYTHASPVPATLGGIQQVIFFTQTGLVSLEGASGKELWRSKFPYSVSTAASPVIGGKDGDVIFCSAGYGVGGGAVKVKKVGDAFTVTELWRTPNKNINHWSTPVAHGDYLYGIFGFKEYAGGKRPGAPVRCLNIETGEEKWSQPGYGSGGGTILVGNTLMVQGDAGALALMEATPEGFKDKGHIQLPGEKFWCAAVLADGKIYARSKNEAFCLAVSGK